MDNQHKPEEETVAQGRNPSSHQKRSSSDENRDWEGEHAFEDLEDSPGVEYHSSFIKPMQSRKVWFVLAGIFLVIAVAVLYVYQAGDTKTILGNQPIPQQTYIYATPAALNVQQGAAAPSVHIHPVQVNPLQPSLGAGVGSLVNPGAAPSGRAGTTSTVVCPHCNTQGIPVCSSCGKVMQPLQNGSNSGLYVCPTCGKVGVPVCPKCGGQMVRTNTQAHLAAAP